MRKSQNGWPVIERGTTERDWPRLRTVKVPGVDVRIPLRDGCAAFLLAHFALWFHECIENLNGKVPDEWGYAPRNIRDSSTVISNHASATALDLNAVKHPRGKRGTFAPRKASRIRRRLKRVFKNQLRAGLTYTRVPDDMHIEIVSSLPEANKLAISLMTSARGKRILAANPGLKEAILR